MTSNSKPKAGVLTSAQLAHLRGLSTCIISSAIEVFNVRLPNTGFLDSSIRCMFDDMPPIAGYVATARIRTAWPPMEGGRYSYARTDWWDHLLAIPSPRVMVIEDMDMKPGVGAFLGEVNASILLAMECVAVVTNGAVRDLREVRGTGFQMFAAHAAVSHAYAHVFEFGEPVQVGGMKIQPGDLIHGDLNGVLSWPPEILDMDRVLAASDEIVRRRRSITELCRSSAFSKDKLHQEIKASMQPFTK